MKKAIFACALLLLASGIAPVSAQRHSAWSQFGYDAFADGQASGIAIAADGTLRPAAVLDSFATFEAERIWRLAQGRDGTLYAATGDGGRLYAIDRNGTSRLLFDSPEISLHSLAIARDGTIYAGSAPDGIVYKITRDGQATVLAHTGSHYVWDLAFDSRGQLHAATGEPAGLLRIDADGQIETLFAPTDHHLMTLLFSDDALYVGSAQKGRIYSVEDGRGRLLFEAPEEEILALVGDGSGGLYAGAIDGGSEESAQHSAIYRLAADGAVRLWWTAPQVLLRDLAYGDDALWLATDDGKILGLNSLQQPSLLVQDDAFRTGRMLRAADGLTYLAAAHTGQLRRLGAAQSGGHYESRVEDFTGHTQWGRAAWRGSGVQLQTRSGNSLEPDATWSDWSDALEQNGTTIASPAARYLQYRIELRGRDAHLERIALHGLRANLPPQIASLEVQPYRMPQGRGGQQQQQAAQNQRNGGPTQPRSLYMLRWQASDPNEEELLYDLYLRGEGQKEWKMAHENEERTSLLWDTATMPEGWTQLKLVASDRGENPPEEALSSEHISPLFAIDNSPPRIEITARVKGGDVSIELDITDRISDLKKVQYSVDYGDDEYPIAAADGLYDSRREQAQCTVAGLAPGEHIIAVQAWDALDNIGTEQIIIQID